MSGSKLTVKFNSSLLAGGKVEVKDYNKSNTKAFRVREISPQSRRAVETWGVTACAFTVLHRVQSQSQLA